jgi:hypothetical protein
VRARRGAGARGTTPYIGWRCRHAHGARVLTSWPTVLGFFDAMGRGVRVWPHRLVVPAVGVPLTPWPTAAGTPSIVGHGTRCLFFEKILVRPIIFRKS